MIWTKDLKYLNKHLYITVDGHDWLIDTGSPVSFGDLSEIEIAGEDFSISKDFNGLTATKLSEHLDHKSVGLIGTDILNIFNTVFDVKSGTITFSQEKVELDGELLPISQVMGIPIVTVKIAGGDRAMFFDTGAQISYLQNETLSRYPSAGIMDDFYPGVGTFQTDTFMIDAKLGDQQLILRCGTLPELLGMTLMMAGTEGIIGNEILNDNIVGYFPKESAIVLVQTFKSTG